MNERTVRLACGAVGDSAGGALGFSNIEIKYVVAIYRDLSIMMLFY